MAGYGIKVETDTGHMVWITETGTTSTKTRAMRFDSELGACIYRDLLDQNNPTANLVVVKL